MGSPNSSKNKRRKTMTSFPNPLQRRRWCLRMGPEAEDHQQDGKLHHSGPAETRCFGFNRFLPLVQERSIGTARSIVPIKRLRLPNGVDYTIKTARIFHRGSAYFIRRQSLWRI